MCSLFTRAFQLKVASGPIWAPAQAPLPSPWPICLVLARGFTLWIRTGALCGNRPRLYARVSLKYLEADFTRKLTLPLPRVRNNSLDLQNCEVVHTKNREESQAVRIYNDKDG